jgi:hypothetical protein
MRIGPIPTTQDVLDHGFPFRASWWTERIPDTSWSAFLADLPDAEGGRGYKRITRSDLLGGSRNASRQKAAQALVASYVWGTGSWAFLVGRRARVFRDTAPDDIAQRLADAMKLVHSDDPVAAYASLARGAQNRILHLGPSFYTKVLYAADAHHGTPGRALILDRFVAIALNDLEEWGLPEGGPWTADQYARWLDHAHTQAHKATNRHLEDTPVRPDAIELAYFQHGKAVYQQRRANQRRTTAG